ncbi:MAG: hypothetical protein QX191_02160 [Methylococcaceae bacterium]
MSANLKRNEALLDDFDDYSVSGEPNELENKLPVLPREGFKTDKTDETDYSNITNDGFIFGVFSETNTARPIVVSFGGDPNKVKPAAWFGKDYVKGHHTLPDDKNNYLSCSSFNLLNGQYRRTKAHFEKYHWLLCDDVGTKVNIDRMGLTPSWIIETSEGN